jgi:hypothetical protein
MGLKDFFKKKKKADVKSTLSEPPAASVIPRHEQDQKQIERIHSLLLRINDGEHMKRGLLFRENAMTELWADHLFDLGFEQYMNSHQTANEKVAAEVALALSAGERFIETFSAQFVKITDAVKMPHCISLRIQNFIEECYLNGTYKEKPDGLMRVEVHVPDNNADISTFRDNIAWLNSVYENFNVEIIQTKIAPPVIPNVSPSMSIETFLILIKQKMKEYAKMTDPDSKMNLLFSIMYGFTQIPLLFIENIPVIHIQGQSIIQVFTDIDEYRNRGYLSKVFNMAPQEYLPILREIPYSGLIFNNEKDDPAFQLHKEVFERVMTMAMESSSN